MMRRLRWGILGTGAIAKTFADELPHSATGVLVAVGSRSREAAAGFVASRGGVRACGSYEELLTDPEVDAVYVSTPHPFHAEWTVAALEAGKHVLCEKPMGMNAGEVEAMVKAARRSGRFLMEAFMYRCHPRMARVAGLIREGAIGRVRVLEAAFSFAVPYDASSRLFNPRLGGGAILDVGCYTVSVVRLLAGAALGTTFAEPEVLSGSIVCAPGGTDLLAAATMKFPDGILAQVSCGIGLARDQDLKIFGEEGSLLVPHFWSPPGPIEIRCGGDVAIEPPAGSIYKYAIEADAVAAALPGLESPCMSWADSLGNARALDRWLSAGG